MRRRTALRSAPVRAARRSEAAGRPRARRARARRTGLPPTQPRSYGCEASPGRRRTRDGSWAQRRTARAAWRRPEARGTRGGPVDAAEDTERRPDQPAHRIGGEDAAYAEVLLARPALERVERDADPDAPGAEAHQQARWEVNGKRVAEHEAECAQRHEGE